VSGLYANSVFEFSKGVLGLEADSLPSPQIQDGVEARKQDN